MKATRLKETSTTEVRLLLGKGVLLILTVDEYVRALNKGKAERRAQRRARHQQQLQAQQEAQALTWITKG